MTIHYVSQNELEGILLRVATVETLGIVALTDADLYVNAGGDRKAGVKCPFQNVQKRALVKRAMTCFSYVRSRDNENARHWGAAIEAARATGDEAAALALEAAGPIKHDLQPRKWGERIQNTPFIRHKDNLYLEMRMQKEGPAKTIVETSYFDEQGNEVSKTDLAPWVKPKRVNDNDPVDFFYREYRTDHVVEVRAGGEVYIVNELAPYAETKAEAIAA